MNDRMSKDFDESTHHIMQSHVKRDAYIWMAWPKDLSLAELDYCKEAVCFQLDAFRKHARRKEAGEVEYDSWAALARVKGG